MDNENKLRLLYTARMFEGTDEENPLTAPGIIRELKDRYGIETYRTTVPTDIALLRQAGMEIEAKGTKPQKYYLNDYARRFTQPELKVLIDAVSSSRFITREKSEELVSKITTLSTPSGIPALKRNLWPEGRIKQENEQIYYVIEAVNQAITDGRKISFQYFEYDIHKEQVLKHGGERYIFSPYALVWNGEYYYVTGYSEKHEGIGNFRIDRIAGVPQILEDLSRPMPEDFDIAEYVNGMLHMYNSAREDVELICDNTVMDAVIDRFGIGADTSEFDGSSFMLKVNVAVNHVFFGWIFGFCGKVRIQSPETVKEKYREMLLEAVESL